MPLKVEKNKLTVAMRHGPDEECCTDFGIRGTGYLHAHTQFAILRIFASTILVPTTMAYSGGSASKVVASFHSHAFSSGGTGFREVVSNSGSGQ
ncbi:hypothetical protein AVEN_234807-1 [Araneus ventricosus]|uniref:Uncharacterized protein n=1 Tax=Araneus ventricosus TaxID=182803 RepID=A0A4Y2F4G3_ARAVE|nr:hypothetical protein AVEN_234807-1 [Araneus ventricosus]